MPAKGEPARMAFATPKFTIGVVMVPDPIEANGRGCTLSAVRLTPKFELAFVSGSGYPANSKVHYRISGNKTTDSVGKSDETGTIRFSLIPYPGQESKGTMKDQNHAIQVFSRNRLRVGHSLDGRQHSARLTSVRWR